MSTTAHTSPTGESTEKTKLKKLIAGTQTGDGDKQYLESVIQTDVGSEYLEFMEPELSRAHQLANRNDAEFYEFAELVKKRTFEFLAQHPPQNSELTGPFRALVYGDGKQPLSLDELRLVESLEQLIISKGSGGRNMKQQDIIKTMRQEVDRTTENKSSSGGFFSRLMGGK